MARKRFTAEQIISKLREAEVEIAKGKAVELVARKLGVTDQTYYRWRKRYGGLKVDQPQIPVLVAFAGKFGGILRNLGDHARKARGQIAQEVPFQ